MPAGKGGRAAAARLGWIVCALATGCGGVLTAGAVLVEGALRDPRRRADDRAPAASVETPAGAVNDIVPVRYRLTDADGDRAGIRVEYGQNGVFRPATAAFVEGAEGVENLEAPAAGAAHVFHWSSTADLGFANQAGVSIRITPVSATNAAQVGEPAVTGTFSLPNRFITTVAQRPVRPGLFVGALATDLQGDVLAADGPGNRVVRIRRKTGQLEIVAGTGEQGDRGDGLLATQAQLNNPSGVVCTPDGDVIFTDRFNQRLRRVVAATGFLDDLAGGGEEAGEGLDAVNNVITPGVLAPDAFLEPLDLARDRLGNPLFLDDHRVRILNDRSGADLLLSQGTGTPNPALPAGPVRLAPTRIISLMANSHVPAGWTAPSAFAAAALREVAAIAVHSSASEQLLYALEGGEEVSAPFPRLVVVNLGAAAATLRSAITGANVVVAPGNSLVVADSTSKLRALGDVTDLTVYQAAGDGRVLLYTSLADDVVVAINLSQAPVVFAGGTTIAPGAVGPILGTGGDDEDPEFTAPLATNLVAPLAVTSDQDGSVFVAQGTGRLRVLAAQPLTLGTTSVPQGTVATVGAVPPGTSGAVRRPQFLAVTPAGDLLLTDADEGDPRSNRLLRVAAADARVTTLLGDGTYGRQGDGGLAVAARAGILIRPAMNAQGIVCVADRVHHRVRAVNTGSSPATFLGITLAPGAVDTVVGTGAGGYGGDGGPPLLAVLREPTALLFDEGGLLWISDTTNHRIRVVNPGTSPATVAGVTVQPGHIQTVFGTGMGGAPGADGDGGPAGQARLSSPVLGQAIVDGVMYLVDGLGPIAPRVRAVNLRTEAVTLGGVSLGPGTIRTVLASGAARLADGSNLGDGGPALQATLRSPRGVTALADGLVFVADEGDHRVRVANLGTSSRTLAGVVVPAGQITTIVGRGVPTFDGDPGTVGGALTGPADVLAFADGRLFVTDGGNGALRLANLGAQPVAFGGIQVPAAGLTVIGGSRSGSVRPDRSIAVGVDPQGTVILSDTGTLGGSPSVLRVDSRTRVVTRLAGVSRGQAVGAKQGDGGPALLAEIRFPFGLHVDGEGSVYLCDGRARRVRFINRAGGPRTPMPGVTVAPGNIDSLLGALNGDQNATNDDGRLVTDPTLDLYVPLAISEAAGVLWVVDRETERVFRIDRSTGRVTGIQGAFGTAKNPTAVVAVDANTAFVAFDVTDVTGGGQVHRLTWTGTSFTRLLEAGSGKERWNGERVAKASMNLGRGIEGLAHDAAAGVLYVSDRGNHRLVAVNLGAGDVVVAGQTIAAGDARTVAGGGQGESGFNGDAIPPDLSLLSQPTGVALGPNGEVVVVDQGNARVRRFQR